MIRIKFKKTLYWDGKRRKVGEILKYRKLGMGTKLQIGVGNIELLKDMDNKRGN